MLTTTERLQKTKQVAARTRKNINYIPRPLVRVFFVWFSVKNKAKRHAGRRRQDRHVAVVW